jgi:hypothetical protein
MRSRQAEESFRFLVLSVCFLCEQLGESKIGRSICWQSKIGSLFLLGRANRLAEQKRLMLIGCRFLKEQFGRVQKPVDGCWSALIFGPDL